MRYFEVRVIKDYPNVLSVLKMGDTTTAKEDEKGVYWFKYTRENGAISWDSWSTQPNHREIFNSYFQSIEEETYSIF